MLTSVLHDQRLAYPDPGEFFSPSERYPECPFDHVAARPNHAYDGVRRCLALAGLDRANHGTPSWNPLGAYIPRGSTVFVLCNFVYHRKAQETREEFFSKCTHGSIVRAIVDYVLIAVGADGRIAFGNAPLQSCDWNRVLDDTGAAQVLDFYAAHQAAVTARDLRLFVAPRDVLGRVTSSSRGDDDDAVTVHLGEQSLLEELYRGTMTNEFRVGGKEVEFRVTDYDPDRTKSFHALHRHDYVINRRILDADVVLSLPKMKTHEKVGITVGLKGMVGCVGHKDCLAHHRFGPPTLHGDEYPDDSRIQVLLSRFHDFVYRRRYPVRFRSLLEVLDRTARRAIRILFRRIQAGAWHGNDTAWRMTIDLARIMHFADRTGGMTGERRRRHLVLVDGILGGEGNGPLSSTPVASRALIFSDGLAAGDVAAARLMGYSPARIPLVHWAAVDATLAGAEPVSCLLNGAPVDVDRLPLAAGRAFKPPVGWSGYL